MEQAGEEEELERDSKLTSVLRTDRPMDGKEAGSGSFELRLRVALHGNVFVFLLSAGTESFCSSVRSSISDWRFSL